MLSFECRGAVLQQLLCFFHFKHYQIPKKCDYFLKIITFSLAKYKFINNLVFLEGFTIILGFLGRLIAHILIYCT